MLTLNKTQLAAIGQAELAPHPGLSLGPALLGYGLFRSSSVSTTVGLAADVLLSP
jgi:hypothetical protein